MILGCCTVLYGGLPGYETVSTGSFGACAEILIQSVFALPEPLLSTSYCILFCCSAVTTACSTAAVPSGYEPRGGVDSESPICSPFRKGYSLFNGEPTSITVG